MQTTRTRIEIMSREKQPKRQDTAVKIAEHVYRQAKMVASYRGVTIAEYLTDLLTTPVLRDYAAMLAEESARVAPPQRGK